jgi:hypothetical protein
MTRRPNFFHPSSATSGWSFSPPEKRARPEHERAIPRIHELRNDFVVQRRRVEKETRARQERHERTGGKPVRVIHRQRVEELVIRTEIDDGAQLLDAREHRVVRDRDTFRSRFRSGREQHDRRILRIGRRQHRARAPERTRNEPQPVSEREILPHLFHIDELHILQCAHVAMEPCDLDETS